MASITTTTTTLLPLTQLAQITKRACDALTPMIVQFYSAINSSTSTLKADKSVFTIADGTVQHLLVEHLYSGNKFKSIVGEEECRVNLLHKPYTVDHLEIPSEFCHLVEQARDQMQSLCSEIPDHPMYSDLTIFIDPIDGTREFSTGKGEQCSICVGFADGQGVPQAGVVYRPITSPPTWAAGASLEDFKAGVLDVVGNVDGSASGTTPGLLTSNGTISPFLTSVMEELKIPRIPSGGCGNKILMLLEGKGSMYIQDRGVSRWDTCGAQAIVEAYGSVLSKLSSFTGDAAPCEPGTLQSYTYVASETNVDFQTNLSYLTAYNTVDKTKASKKGEERIKATDVAWMQPYSNLAGLMAVEPTLNNAKELKHISNGCQRAKSKHAPAFD